MSSLAAPFLSGFFLSGGLIMAIGAQNLFLLRQGLRREHVPSLVLFFGMADALLILAGVAGVGAFLAAIPQLMIVLSLGGAAFLAWYGISAWRRMASPAAMIVTDTDGITLAKALTMAAVFTFLNPHVYLDTILMGTAGAAQPHNLRPIFVIGAATASFTWFASLGFGARLLKPVFARPTAWRVLDAIVGIVMLTLAASLLMHALPAFS